MKLTEHCFAVLGLGYTTPWAINAGFVTGGDTTLIIDTGPNFLGAQTIYGYAKNIKPENNLVVINSEKHLDHIGGNCLFKEKGVKIYGHKLINRTDDDLIEDMSDFNKSITNEKRRSANEENVFYSGTKIINPDFSVSNHQTFDLGNGIKARIIYTLGHTQTNISVYIPNEKVLYCGDCIVNGYIPNLEAGVKEDWDKWITSLALISELDLDFVVPGHGNIIAGKDIPKAIKRMKTVLEEAIYCDKAPTV